MRTGLELILFGISLWILLSALLAPLESLGWWAGWFGESPTDREVVRSTRSGPGAPAVSVPPGAQPPVAAEKSTNVASAAEYFIVFLTGIAGVAQEVHLPEEQQLLRRLKKRLPAAEVVDDIFPYSVTNRALTGQRVFAWFWRYALASKEKGGRIGFVINIRNLFQVLVSADRRYGPIYNRGTAQLILNGLQRRGYVFGSDTPVILMGYSGGSQISVGALPYLKEHLSHSPVMISLGGVLCADPGLAEVEQLYHVRGRRDRVEQLGVLLSPGRWSLFHNSPWNRGLSNGTIRVIDMGDMAHNGPGGYLDDQSRWDRQNTYMDKTVHTLVTLIKQSLPREKKR